MGWRPQYCIVVGVTISKISEGQYGHGVVVQWAKDDLKHNSIYFTISSRPDPIFDTIFIFTFENNSKNNAKNIFSEKPDLTSNDIVFTSQNSFRHRYT